MILLYKDNDCSDTFEICALWKGRCVCVCIMYINYNINKNNYKINNIISSDF